MNENYEIGACIVGGLAFLVIWVGSMFVFGALGFFLGWIPASILAAILGLIWPLTVIAGIVVIVVIAKLSS